MQFQPACERAAAARACLSVRHLHVLACAALLAALLCLTAAPHAHAQEAAAIGAVQRSTGSVSIISPRGERPARTGEPIAELERIQTGADGQALIRLNDGTLLAMRANTQLTPLRYRQAAAAGERDGMVMQLLKGSLRAVTGLIGKRSPETVQFRTATGTIGIRGTDFEMTLVDTAEPGAPLEGLYHRVNEGATVLENIAGEQLPVSAGQVALAPADLAKHRAQFGLIKDGIDVLRLFRVGPFDADLPSAARAAGNAAGNTGGSPPPEPPKPAEPVQKPANPADAPARAASDAAQRAPSAASSAGSSAAQAVGSAAAAGTAVAGTVAAVAAPAASATAAGAAADALTRPAQVLQAAAGVVSSVVNAVRGGSHQDYLRAQAAAGALGTPARTEPAKSDPTAPQNAAAATPQTAAPAAAVAPPALPTPSAAAAKPGNSLFGEDRPVTPPAAGPSGAPITPEMRKAAAAATAQALLSLESRNAAAEAARLGVRNQQIEEYRFAVAKAIYAANSKDVYPAPLPPLVPAIVILHVEVDAAGELVDLHIYRHGADRRFSPRALEILRSIKYPKPEANLFIGDTIEWTETVLFEHSGKFQLKPLAPPQRRE
ncbi:hypothetical protein IP84_10420 [beta proteobacterium AAP99]|nr:hypothetical protein IP84_10420 [beta proteobacterium AAP99]